VEKRKTDCGKENALLRCGERWKREREAVEKKSPQECGSREFSTNNRAY
jgi:hypothetical protein